MEVFANGGVLAGLKIHHFQSFTVMLPNSGGGLNLHSVTTQQRFRIILQTFAMLLLPNLI